MSVAYEWLPEDPTMWTTDPGILRGRLCRNMKCPEPAIAAMWRRGRRSVWWGFCSQHMFGRRVREGIVEAEYFVGTPGHAAAVLRGERPRGGWGVAAPVVRAGIPPEALEERCAKCGGPFNFVPWDGPQHIDVPGHSLSWDAYADAIGRRYRAARS